MSDETRQAPASGRAVSWLIGCALIGWVVVYNAMRLTGSTPSSAAWVSLGIGAAAGVAVFAIGLLLVRRRSAGGGSPGREAGAIPSPLEMDDSQRRAIAIAWPVLGVLAILALVVGLMLVGKWIGADEGDRGISLLILAAWDILVAIWLGDEAIRLRRLEAEGLDAIVLGCALTAVLAGVAFSRELYEPLQVLLAIGAGVGALVVGLVFWHLRGRPGLPVAPVVGVIVAALAIILPAAL